MDSHPLARRPHKSPAHTVKDRRNRPQRLIPFSLSVIAEAPDRAAHYRVVFVAVNTLLRFFFSPADRSRCREGLTFWRVSTDSSTPAFLFRPAPLEARQDTVMWAAHYREVSESVNSPALQSFLRFGSFPKPSLGPRIVGKYRNPSTPSTAFSPLFTSFPKLHSGRAL